MFKDDSGKKYGINTETCMLFVWEKALIKWPGWKHLMVFNNIIDWKSGEDKWRCYIEVNVRKEIGQGCCMSLSFLNIYAEKLV